MKNREEFWDETMGKLDEGLIERAAEELKDEDVGEEEYVGVRVEKIPVSSKRTIPFAPIIASAAAVCLIVGGVFAVRNLPIGVAKPSESSETNASDNLSITTPPVTTIVVSEEEITDSEDKGEIVGQVIWGSDSEEEMRLDLYEYYFFGQWQDKDSEETFTLNYYEDFITSECSFIGFNETDTEVCLYFSTFDKNCTCIISKSNTNIMYIYGTDTGSEDDNIYQSDLTNTCYRLSAGEEWEKSVVQDTIDGHLLGYFGRVKLLQYLASKETISRNYGESALYALTSKPLYNEETGYYKSEFIKNQTDKECYFRVFTWSYENIALQIPYSPIYGGETVNMSIEIELQEGEWVITDVRGNDKKIYSVVGESDEVISAEKIQEIADHSGSFDFGLLERSFYGHWDIVQSGNGSEEKIKLTYNSDFFIRGYVYPSCFYEDENCYYLLYIGGGMGQLLLIDKSNPDIMYSYTDIEMMDIPRDSGTVYIRDQFVELNLDITNGCAVSFLGLMKFKNDYGFDLSEMDSFTDESGNTWVHGEATWGEGYGDIYVNENSDDRIVFSKRYYRDDLVQEAAAEEEHNIPSDMSVYQYFRITAEKQNGEYSIVSREKYAEEMLKDREKMSSEYLNLVDEETEQINNMIEEENLGDLSSTVIATSFYTDLSGKYYAIREAGNNMGQVMQYGELFYYDGEGYKPVETGMFGNLKAYISGDRLFLFGVYRDDESEELYDPVFLNVYRDGEKIFSEEFGRSSPLIITSREIGDFIAFSYIYDMENSEGEKIVSNRNILVNKYDVNVNYVTVDDIAIDKSNGIQNFNADYDTEKREFKGFTVNPDGQEYSYKVNSDSLEDCLYELEWLYSDIYNSFYLGLEEGSGSISVNSLIYNELKNFKSYEELNTYLGRVFTEEAAAEIRAKSEIDFYNRDGKLYAYNNPDSDGKEKRRVRLSVQSVDGNEAVVNIGILSDSENDNELPTLGTATMVKTEKGWRISEQDIIR